MENPHLRQHLFQQGRPAQNELYSMSAFDLKGRQTEQAVQRIFIQVMRIIDQKSISIPD